MKISILHLEDGLHHFSSHVKGETLQFYGAEIYPNDILVDVELNKFENNINCIITLRTKSHHKCDRCLVEYDDSLHERFQLLFHYGYTDFATEEEGVLKIVPDQHEIDLLPYIQENLILAIPMKNLCMEDCKGICSGCGADLNTERCTCEETNIDPRWEKLRELKQ